MSGTINKVIIVGNVGKDPDIRKTQDGREIANLTLATSESWTDKASGEKKEKVQWHKVAVFNPGLVNIVKQYVTKGSKLYVEGQLQTRKWQDAAGQDKYSTEIVIQGFNGSVILLDSKESNDTAKSNGYQPDDMEAPF